MATDRKLAVRDRRSRLTRGASHYEMVRNGLQICDKLDENGSECTNKPVVVKCFLLPERTVHMV